MRLVYTPKTAIAVVAFGECDLPAVFVEIENAAGVDVILALLQRRFEFPDPVEFVASQLGVDVLPLQDVLRPNIAAVQAVRVVG